MTSVALTDLCWLAGILEGEGYFHVSKCHVSGKTYRYPRITVGMTDLDVIEKVAGLFGTKPNRNVRNGRGKLPIHRAIISGDKAASWMRILRSHMHQRRRAKIDEILKEHDSRPDPNKLRREASALVSKGRSRDV